jgi:multiple sugar transport system permease protein
VSCILPWYVITRTLGLIDTYPPLIATHLVFTLPLCVGVMIGYFEDVPRELEEAAWLDGCSRLGAFVRIALPLVRPGLVATAILGFTTSWNNFLFALVLTGTKLKTAPVAVFNFISFEEYNWGAVSAAALLITSPSSPSSSSSSGRWSAASPPAASGSRYLVRDVATRGIAGTMRQRSFMRSGRR